MENTFFSLFSYTLHFDFILEFYFYFCFQREQLRDHEERVNKLETDLDEHRRHPPEKGSKALTIQNYKEKDAYLQYEVGSLLFSFLRLLLYLEFGFLNNPVDIFYFDNIV